MHIKKTVIINLGTPHRRRPTPHLRRRALTRVLVDFEEGWWIVEIVWYKHERGTWPRKYTRLPLSSKRWLSVSAIVRVEDLEFEGGERNSRSGVRVLSNDLTELVRACL